LNKEDKEVDAYVEGYIAFMRQCKCESRGVCRRDLRGNIIKLMRAGKVEGR
jgi:hypothetical protein